MSCSVGPATTAMPLPDTSGEGEQAAEFTDVYTKALSASGSDGIFSADLSLCTRTAGCNSVNILRDVRSDIFPRTCSFRETVSIVTSVRHFGIDRTKECGRTGTHVQYSLSDSYSRQYQYLSSRPDRADPSTNGSSTRSATTATPSTRTGGPGGPEDRRRQHAPVVIPLWRRPGGRPRS